MADAFLADGFTEEDPHDGRGRCRVIAGIEPFADDPASVASEAS